MVLSNEKKTKALTFFIGIQQFDYLVELTGEAAYLTVHEKEYLKKSLAAKIITATAYFSDCVQKDRIIVKHLLNLVAAGFRVPRLYAQREDESIEERFQTGYYFPGGRPQAVQAGLILVCLLSLNDHLHDLRDDRTGQRYNPLNHYLYFEVEKKRLMNRFEELEADVKNQFQSLYDEVLSTSFWN